MTDYIKVDDLVFEYAKIDDAGNTILKRAIKGISFRVPKGSFTAIISGGNDTEISGFIGGVSRDKGG